MTTIIRATDAAQFLGLVPHLLGFHPADSIVLVPFTGITSLGAMRLDLESRGADTDEDAAAPAKLVESPAETVDRVAATAIGMVCRLAEADAAALVIYTDDPISDARLPHEQMARAVARRADACGIELRDALCVASNGWASFLDAERPADGHPLHLLRPGDDSDPLPPVGPGDQHAGADLGVASPERVAEVTAALTALSSAFDANDTGAHTDPRALEAWAALDDVPELLEKLLEADELPPFEAALAVSCLSRPATRDVALLQWSGTRQDGDAALAAQLRWEAGAPYPEELGARVWGDGARPDPHRLARGLEIARECAALTIGEHRAAVLGLCAWLAWAQGRSTVAGDYATRACALGEARLAEIVLAFVNAAHLPEWAFSRAAA